MERQKKEKKQELAQSLSQKIKDICEANIVNIKSHQIEEIAAKIDLFEENTQRVDTNLQNIKKHNHQLKNAIPFMEDQIKAMQEEIDKIEQSELTPDELIEELFGPKDELAEKLMKKDVKLRSIQDTLEGLRQIDEISDLKEWTKQVRKMSAKQFSSVYKINKLKEALSTASADQEEFKGY